MGLFDRKKSVGRPKNSESGSQECPACGKPRPARISLQATPKLIKDLDDLVEPLGFKDRSELIRTLLREGVERHRPPKDPRASRE